MKRTLPRRAGAVEKLLGTLLAVVAICNPVLAGGETSAEAQPAPPGILVATTDEGVRYVAGGVGSDERKIMEQLAAGYNVKFMFADTMGEYVSDVTVRIDDLAGKSFARLVTNGPWLYLKLSPGGYRVRATHAAQTMQVQRLEVPRTEGVVLMLQWTFPADDTKSLE